MRGLPFVPVITAHPTEVRRKSILDREDELSGLLEQREAASIQTADQDDIDMQIKRAIRILWQTRMLRDNRITVQDEIENNLSIFVRTFLTALPSVKRRIARLFRLDQGDDALSSSWVLGGRRPRRQSQCLARKRWTMRCAVRPKPRWIIILAEIHALGAELSLSDVPGFDQPGAEGPRSHRQGDIRFTRRTNHTAVALTTCYARMAATRKALLGAGPGGRRGSRPRPMNAPEDFAADLDIIAASLTDNGDADLAEGRLLNLRESMAAFGFHLATMDVRQNCDVHERAVAELLRTAGADGDYLAMEEAARRRCLLCELSHAASAALALRRIFGRDGARAGHIKPRELAEEAVSAKTRSPIM